jgi:hypothetical protein
VKETGEMLKQASTRGKPYLRSPNPVFLGNKGGRVVDET